ncbi:mechanosensitive ion channel family protein [Anoxynatronum buryatiense]|uniref:Small conductance mechanosensitive channel n=1 Tax=Anoxynatronum buryatiense TaxID=489973 RepID=A0AA45WWE6_9CLOT|nr:mechanosensitive ion channel family protein [Anoxynatronum buryatiense]SMP59150.1 small conductance mechanosensitive channel [Anoxynatronum buryatiense]
MEVTEVTSLWQQLLHTYQLITETEVVGRMLGFLIRLVIILLLARVAIKVLQAVVSRVFSSRQHLKFKVDEARVNTLEGLMTSIIKYTIYFIAGTSVLNMAGVQVGALIATAGVGGLALGFGAQNLVRDVITGFFILFENQFSVGDYVEVDGSGGIVEEMALRVTKVRDFNGDLHIVPNGAISHVVNKSNGKMRALVNISIAYEEDIERALEVLRSESEKLAAANEKILEGPIVLGVTELGDSDVVLAVLAKTEPMEQWAIEREMRKAFKLAFDRERIEIPYPRRVLYQRGNDKEKQDR